MTDVPMPDEGPPAPDFSEVALALRRVTWDRNIKAVLYDIYQTTGSYTEVMCVLTSLADSTAAAAEQNDPHGLLIHDYKRKVEVALFGDLLDDEN